MKKLLNLISDTGLRVTNSRKLILSTLTSHPQTAKQVYLQLAAQNQTIDLATVYRTLDLFVNLEIVDRTQLLDKTWSYELRSDHNHHHHLVCEDCGLVEDIDLDEKFLMREVKKQTRFQVTHHALEFFGICHNCQRMS